VLGWHAKFSEYRKGDDIKGKSPASEDGAETSDDADTITLSGEVHIRKVEFPSSPRGCVARTSIHFVVGRCDVDDDGAMIQIV
jgi:hypothetical protein